jgi:uncharacterized protein YfaT (DUF1175 family)
MGRALCLAAVLACAPVAPSAQVRLADQADREAFRAWFVFIADVQFYRPTADVTDCAGLIRHAAREALRAHTPEWLRLAALPLAPGYPDVRSRPAATPAGLPIFRVADRQFAEFADAKTIVGLNTRPLGREVAALRPADLLYFRQEQQASPDHLMVFVGRSRFERDGDDWVVYHTGPIDGGPGEVRKTRLADLLRHPAARWRPVTPNPAFVGVFRLDWL